MNTLPVDTEQMDVMRRVSAAFKDIPGGQMLGPSPDFSHRLFNLELVNETPAEFRAALEQVARTSEAVTDAPTTIPKVLSFLRAHGLVPEPVIASEEAFDITRAPLTFPAPRSAALAVMARAQQGSLLALAYSNMRGYGDIHPTVAELRVGYVPVHVPHPVTGEPVEVGEVLMTECEVVAMFEAEEAGQLPTFNVGYGACFGHNESKAIGMAVLDRALQRGAADGSQHPSEDPEFVLLHLDGVDAMGFCVHYKMPHYVTFQSDLDRLRATQDAARRTAPEQVSTESS
jgi:alpha-D-ribose 1-methylphosphonate 5-triphosphate synthase subunit PhnI